MTPPHPCRLLCAVAARWLQPTGLRTGLPAAHLPAGGEDQPAAGDQPPASEAHLQPAEEQQDEQEQRGALLSAAPTGEASRSTL